MFNNASGFDSIYIACGYTDLRRGIDGLAGIIQQEFNLDPFQNSLFLFCGRAMDSFFCINTLRMESMSGQETNLK